jgi:hypothetical protein
VLKVCLGFGQPILLLLNRPEAVAHGVAPVMVTRGENGP